MDREYWGWVHASSVSAAASGKATPIGWIESCAGDCRPRGYRSTGRLAESVARLEDQNENLRRELVTLKARIAQMEHSELAAPTVLVGVAAREDRAVSATAVDSMQLARERARADQAESSVVELRAELAKAHQAARSRQTDLDDKDRQIERPRRSWENPGCAHSRENGV